MGGMGIFWEARPYLEEIPTTLTWLEIHAFSMERSAAHCSRIMQNKWWNVENVALTRVKEPEEVQSRSEHSKEPVATMEQTRNPWRRTSCGIKYYRRLYCQSRFLDGNRHLWMAPCWLRALWVQSNISLFLMWTGWKEEMAGVSQLYATQFMGFIQQKASASFWY